MLASSPFSLARPSTAATSWAKPRVRRPPQRVRPLHRLRGLGQQLAEHDVLLRGAEQPQRAGVQLGWGVAADQAVGEGVERRAHRARGGPAEAGGDPVAQLLGGLAAERQGQHRLGAGSPVLDAVHDGLDQRRGLPGAGTRQHEQRPAVVVDHRLLELVEDGRRHRPCARTGQPVGRLVTGRSHGSTQTPVTDSTERQVSPQSHRGCQKARGMSMRPDGRSGVPSSR